jgi:hypothetical protein
MKIVRAVVKRVTLKQGSSLQFDGVVPTHDIPSLAVDLQGDALQILEDGV